MLKSDSIKEIATALTKFQAEVKNPTNSANNPFFKSKYAPLNEILNDVRPLLSKYGLSVLQMPSGDGEQVIITTLLMHDSGEWIESCPLKMKPAKNDPQGIGSAITYGRRYALAAILGISSEDDDDGNAASNGKADTGKASQTDSLVTDAQLKKMFAMAKSKQISEIELKNHMAKFGKSSSKELTKKEVEEVFGWIEKYKVEVSA